jgi:hypothetical protein
MWRHEATEPRFRGPTRSRAPRIALANSQKSRPSRAPNGFNRKHNDCAWSKPFTKWHQGADDFSSVCLISAQPENAPFGLLFWQWNLTRHSSGSGLRPIPHIIDGDVSFVGKVSLRAPHTRKWFAYDSGDLGPSEASDKQS